MAIKDLENPDKCGYLEKKKKKGLYITDKSTSTEGIRTMLYQLS